MRWWKIAGLAGFVGIAATGAVVARSERRRRAYTPEEIRARLHDRVGEATAQARSSISKPSDLSEPSDLSKPADPTEPSDPA